MVLVIFCFSNAFSSIIKYMVANLPKHKDKFKNVLPDKLSGLLFIPYVLWLFFASYLNLFIVINN